MSKILFISNIAKRVGSFSVASIEAAHRNGLDYYTAANWTDATEEQIREDEQKYNVKIINIDLARSPYSPKNITAYKQLVKLINEEGIDYIHCNTPVGGLLGRLAGKKCKVKKVIYQAHGFHFYKGAPLKNWLIYYPIERWLAHYTDALITINKEDYERAQDFKLRKNGRVEKVPGVGVDLSKFDKEQRKTEKGEEIRLSLRKTWNIDPSAFVFVSVGELNDNKNQEVAIRALAKANDPNFYYLICGEGENRKYLVELAEQLGVGKQVKLLGFQSNIPEVLLACDCFVFTSFREGLPGALMEAMASGLPCIASKIRGCTDLLGDSDYLFDPKDADELADKMRSIVDKGERLCEVTRNSNNVVNFDLDHAIQSLKKLYKSVEDR